MTLHTYRLDLQPGNGTRYRLVVALDAINNIACIAWPDMRWSAGDFGQYVSAHWLYTAGGLSSKADAEVIADAVMALVQGGVDADEEAVWNETQRGVR